jgi:hypothetical protein
VKRIIFAISIFTLFHVIEEVNAQNVNLNKEAKTLTYEELYDTPYDINKLFIHLQPMYGELFTTNSTVGWGIKAHYYLKNIADIEGHIRAPYGRSFDLTMDAAFKNSTVDNEARPYTYSELIFTYHIKDEEQDTETKFILYSKRYKGDKWGATVPSHTIIPTKVRKIYGARFGGMAYKSSVDYSRIMDLQGVTLYSDEGGEIGADESVYGNMTTVGFYIGGSMALIKNVAVQPDKIYGTLVSDLIFTTYFDVNFTPLVTVDDIYDDGIRYSSEPILKSVLGFRVGLEGKFNRKFSWGYGGEIGYRPGLQQSGFFALIKISLPIFSTQLRYQVESFGK